MEERKCKSCGDPLRDIGFGKYICDYCGSMFENHYNDIRFLEVLREPAERIAAQCTIPYYMRENLNPDELTSYSLSELARSLADGLKGFMKVIVSEDPSRMATIVRGEVRVIPPDHQF